MEGMGDILILVLNGFVYSVYLTYRTLGRKEVILTCFSLVFSIVGILTFLSFFPEASSVNHPPKMCLSLLSGLLLCIILLHTQIEKLRELNSKQIKTNCSIIENIIVALLVFGPILYYWIFNPSSLEDLIRTGFAICITDLGVFIYAIGFRRYDPGKGIIIKGKETKVETSELKTKVERTFLFLSPPLNLTFFLLSILYVVLFPVLLKLILPFTEATLSGLKMVIILIFFGIGILIGLPAGKWEVSAIKQRWEKIKVGCWFPDRKSYSDTKEAKRALVYTIVILGFLMIFFSLLLAGLMILQSKEIYFPVCLVLSIFVGYFNGWLFIPFYFFSKDNIGSSDNL